ncbi:MAG: 16S rRNA (cytosine(967)-C(5))-methyltransferase RsmB, partial [Myxococcota bacterium]
MESSSPRARRAALDVLVRVDRDRAYADRTLDALLRRRTGLSGRDRGFVTELVYGTLRHGIYIDFILNSLASRPLSKTPVLVRNALRMGVHQLLHMRVPSHAAVNETVNLVRANHKSTTGFVNAMLRKVARLDGDGSLPTPEPPESAHALAVAGSHPEWLVQEMLERFGLDEVRDWVAANNQTPPLMLRANPLRTTRESLMSALEQEGLGVNASTFLDHGLEVQDAGHVTQLDAFKSGECSVQDYAAQLVTVLSAPQPGMTVLDACAAPGGKSGHAAEAMNNQGHVLAVDVHPGRTQLIAKNATRLGLSAIHPATFDASQPDTLSEELAKREIEGLDRAVVDAPCSGMGTLRRNPELRRRARADLKELTALQDALLSSIAPHVKPGGRLVYSVCTVTQAEGIERVRAFLA